MTFPRGSGAADRTDTGPARQTRMQEEPGAAGAVTQPQCSPSDVCFRSRRACFCSPRKAAFGDEELLLGFLKGGAGRTLYKPSLLFLQGGTEANKQWRGFRQQTVRLVRDVCCLEPGCEFNLSPSCHLAPAVVGLTFKGTFTSQPSTTSVGARGPI